MLDQINKYKRALASIYLKNIKSDYKIPIIHNDYFDVYHIFNILHDYRDDVRDYLLKNNIKTEIHYPIAPHKQKALSFLSHLELPISEKIHNSTISLPISTFHTFDDIYKVVEVLNKF
jgi:dTDP-4-amino-4,6-dideoxygalactose transaminase